MGVCLFECCVLSGRGLCDGLITRPEESYRGWCVVVCDCKPHESGGYSPRWVPVPQRQVGTSVRLKFILNYAN